VAGKKRRGARDKKKRGGRKKNRRRCGYTQSATGAMKGGEKKGSDIEYLKTESPQRKGKEREGGREERKKKNDE